MPGEVTALKHELGDDTVEAGTSVTEAMFASGELTEVFGCLWYDVVVKFEDDPAGWLAVNRDIELETSAMENQRRGNGWYAEDTYENVRHDGKRERDEVTSSQTLQLL